MESAEKGSDTGFLKIFASKLRTHDLREAVARGREDLVKRFLAEGEDPHSLKGEGRKDTAVHVAARRGRPDIMGLLLGFIEGKKPQFSSAEDVFAAFPSIMAANSNGDSPLHIAAKSGHVETVRVLLSVFDTSTLSETLPPALSEDAWFNAFPAVIQKNEEEDTPLHIAARRGHSDIMELLLGLTDAKKKSFGSVVAKCVDTGLKAHGENDVEKRTQHETNLIRLFASRNRLGESPVKAMATGERCPGDVVCWFFVCFCACKTAMILKLRAVQKDFEKAARKEAKQRIEVATEFFSLATSFPKEASTFLKIADECGEGDLSHFGMLDPRNLRCLRDALLDDSTQDVVTKNFAEMMRRAPRASSVVLDALTYTPYESDADLDPMPHRFVPPTGKLYPLTFAYEKEREWLMETHAGPPPRWHAELRNAGDSNNQMAACEVRVVHFRGLAQPHVLCNLAASADDAMFSNFSVLALLTCVWEQLRCLFIQDMVYESVAIIVLSRWTFDPSSSVFQSSADSSFASRLSWTLVAGQGVLEATILLWTGMRHVGAADGAPTYEWACRNWHRIVLSVQTIGIAIASTEDHWPSMDHKISLALGTTSFFHWLTVLYKLRAFVKTGTRLLPILKSITPLGGMLVILTFLLLGFIHVFWGWKRSHSDEVSTWHILTFLFIGDNFMNDDFLMDLSSERRWLLMVLGGSSYFVFSCWTLNLFIAVLSEVYEQEQEQMFVTFLRERACICSFLRLRPQLPFPRCARAGCLKWAGINHGWIESLLLFLLGATSTITATVVCMQLEINNWPAALLLAFWALLQQAFMQCDITKDWDEKFLWYCADTSGVEEILSLGHKPKDGMFPQCRSWKLKGYITEILSRMEMQDNAIAKLGEASAKSEAELKGKLKELGKQLSNIAAQLPPGCRESAPTHKEATAQSGEASQTSSHKDTMEEPEEIASDEPVLETQECATESLQTQPVAGPAPRAKSKRRAKGNKNHERLAMDANGT